MSSDLSVFRKYTRGGQLAMHSIRMLLQASKYVLKIAFFLTCFSLICFFFVLTEPQERYIVREYYKYKLQVNFNADNYYKSITLNAANGKPYSMLAGELLKDKRALKIVQDCKEALYWSFLLTVATGLLIICCLVKYFIKKSDKMSSKTVLRGASRADSAIVRKKLLNSKEKYNLTLAGMPFYRSIETQHTLLLGSSGTGKSLSIMEMLDGLRKNRGKAVIYDPSGTFTSIYYRKGKDILLNPLDVRCPVWNIWEECIDSADFEAFAESLIPQNTANSDPFWINAARTIFAVSAFVMREQNPNIRELLTILTSKSLDSIQRLVKDTIAEPLAAKEIEKTAISIKATLTTYSKALLYLPDDTKTSDKELFSISKWIANPSIQDSFLIIGTNKKKKTALNPLLSAWLDIAARAILSLHENIDRRVWFFVDELPSLQKLPSLSELLAEGRKSGACVLAGIQDIHQMRLIYGREGAEALLSLFNTILCLRVNSPETAKWVERALGAREILDIREGKTYGAHEMRDGVSLNQERRKESLVMDAEILNLNNLEGFIKFPGDIPISKVSIPIVNREALVPILVQRDMEDVLLLQRKIGLTKELTEDISELNLAPQLVSKDTDSNIPTTDQSMQEIEIPENNDSLFMAIAYAKAEMSDNDLNIDELQKDYRKLCVKSLLDDMCRDDLLKHIQSGEAPVQTKDKYIKLLSIDLPGGPIEIKILATLLQNNIICHYRNKLPTPYPTDQGFSKSIHILDKGNGYFNYLKPTEGDASSYKAVQDIPQNNIVERV